MIKKTFKMSLYVVPATAALILFATHLWIPDYLIVPPGYSGFVFQLESSITVLLIIFYSLILPNRFEIELGLTKGYSTLKLVFSKVIPIFVYSTLITLGAVLLYKYKPFDMNSGIKSAIRIYVPENFRLCVLFSAFVTIIFFSSVFLFIRVLLRNCYLPIIPDLLIVSLFFGLNEQIRKGVCDIRMCLIDPFISTYFVGNTVPNTDYKVFRDLFIIKNVWTVNRLIFLILSVAFLAATVFLLRREKLHRGMAE